MGHGKEHTVRHVIKGLIVDDGWKGLYRGLGPRFFSSSAWGTSMILAYEYLSKDYNLFLPPSPILWNKIKSKNNQKILF